MKKLLSSLDQKYFRLGVGTSPLLLVSYFISTSLYELLLGVIGIFFWAAIILLLVKKYRHRAKSYLVGLMGSLLLVAILAIALTAVLVAI